MIMLILVSAVGALTYPMNKIVLAYVSPLVLVACRLTLAGILFLGYHANTTHTRHKSSWQDWVFAAHVAFFSFYAPYILEGWALQWMSSAKTAFLYSLLPAVTAVFSRIFFQEKITYRKLAGLLVSVVAVAPLVWESTPGQPDVFGPLSWPELAVLAAMLSFAYAWILMRKVIKSEDVSWVQVYGRSMLLAGVAAGLSAYAVGLMPQTRALISLMDARTLLIVLSMIGGLVLIGNVLGYILSYYVLRRYTATIFTFSGQITPLFAMLYAFLFLGEPITRTFLFSALCLCIGISIVYREEYRQGYFSVS